jgi:hypothetical protein
MTDNIKCIVEGNVELSGSGGGKGDSGSDPGVEASNNLYNKSIARLIDVICEGEIEGLVDGDKSIFLNGTQLESDAGGDNFGGVKSDVRVGTHNQSPIEGFQNSTPATTNVGIQLLYNNPVSRTITDSDVDHAHVIVSVPTLQVIDPDTGDINETSVTVEVKCNDMFVGNVTIVGKCTSTYQRTFKIDNLTTYGAAPWTLKLTRTTADSDSAYLSNSTYWITYDEIIDAKFEYQDTAYVALKVNSEEFGTSIPSRVYEIDALKIEVPNNRNSIDRSYSGEWNGTFKTEWCDNPAWVMYDLLVNTRYGLGLDPSKVDKAKLYTIGQYCDTYVPYYEASVSGTEPRFTFNGVIQRRQDAFKALEAVAQCMRSRMYWAGGQISFMQDSPADATRVFNTANVEDGLFDYESSAISARHTAIMVAWNDPDDLYNKAIELVEDVDGIQTYGWREKRETAFGCTSRGQAIRLGKWVLDSEQNETELVKFTAGWDAADLIPGEIIKVADSHYTAKRWGGRLVSATINQLVLDTSIAFVPGNGYSIDVLTSSGVVMSKGVTNPGTTTDTINLVSSLTEAPQVYSMFNITSDGVEEPRQFRVLQNIETDKHKFEIVALLHDPNKYARVEDGVYFDPPPYSDIPEGELSPPENLQGEEFSYIEGGLDNQYFGVKLGWTASSDVRTEYYEVEKATISGSYTRIGETSTIYFEDKPLIAGTYWYRVRGKSAAAVSAYITLDNFNVYTTTSGLPDITGLQVVGGGYAFTGKDCEIEWSPITNTVSGVLRDYKVVVRKGDDDTLLRNDYSFEPNYTYSYEKNLDDTGGTPIRNPKFEVYGRDIYDGISANPATHVMTNAAPSMAGTTPTVTPIYLGLKIDWSSITPADTDLLKYKVYCSTFTPPTDEIAEVSTDTTYWFEQGLSSANSYYTQIEPYDGFGVGSKSSINPAKEPLKVGEVDIDAELTTSILISDSISTASGTLPKLYDRNTTSSGITYSGGAWRWINYNFGIENFIDRVSVYADIIGAYYVAYKRQDGNWEYLKAEADHSLNVNGELLNATNEADAQTNYWTGVAGKNVGIFPQRIIASECRLYLYTSTNLEIFELVFMREIIAEQVTADNLSAISADVGVITAGVIQSNNLTTTEGILIDLDNDDLKIGGTTDPKFYWDNSEDTLFIDGTIDATRKIRVQEGGYIVVGDQNIMLDSTQNSLWVAPNGGRINNNYIELKDGELDSYYWDGSQHQHYKSVTRLESGVAANDTVVTIPGIFLSEPKVMISPNSMDTYIASYASQSQKIVYESVGLQETSPGSKTWQFTPRATLELTSGAIGNAINDTETRNVSVYASWVHLAQSPTIALAGNTRTVTATMSVQGYTGDSYGYIYGSGESATTRYRRKYYAEHLQPRLYYYRNGAWAYVYTSITGNQSNYNTTYTRTLTVPTQSYDITYFYCRLVHAGQTSNYLVSGDWSANPGDITYQKLIAISYTSNQVAATALAEGTLNWIAIGA